MLRGALVSFGPDLVIPPSAVLRFPRRSVSMSGAMSLCSLSTTLVLSSPQSLLTCSSVSMIFANVSCKWAFDVSHFSMSGLGVNIDFAVRQIVLFSRSGEVFVLSVSETQLVVHAQFSFLPLYLVKVYRSHQLSVVA